MIPFFLKTLLHLGFQLTVTGVTANTMRKERISKKWLWLIFILILFICMQFEQIPLPIRMIMFFIFSVLNGFILSAFLKHTTAKDIESAIFYTMFLFVTMCVVGYFLMKYHVDITPLILFVSMYSLTMLVVYMYMAIFDAHSKTTREGRQLIRVAAIALIALYIVVDTYMNFEKDYDNDLVRSTLAYYTDVVSLFQNLLGYFSNEE